MLHGNVAVDHFQSTERNDRKEKRFLHNGYHQKAVTIQPTFRNTVIIVFQACLSPKLKPLGRVSML